MLTRLKVSGFKNLVDVDVRFGPFTCIAGANGVGKSNLFDAIRFLSALANKPLLEAALSVRDEEGRASDIRNLFHRIGDSYAPEMSFEVEMIIPAEGYDDLNQPAKASITFLRYSVTLAYREGDSLQSRETLELLYEELVHINLRDARQSLPFIHEKIWRKSVIRGRKAAPFISTDGVGEKRTIKLHQDQARGSGRTLLAASLPRTVLSSANAVENPTVLLARREMQSWRLLQLEPSALRRSDELTAPSILAMNGAHLPSTLKRLADSSETKAYTEIANRLAELIDDVYEVWVGVDDRRRLLTLYLTDKSKTSHPAESLSDGTLRFLALAVLEIDPESTGVICLEEPENGIHPERIPAMLHLLQDIAVDVEEEVNENNPLRQIIINTHSPSVVMQVPEDSLILAELKEKILDGQRFKGVYFSGLSNTWRDDGKSSIVSKGNLLSYLGTIGMRRLYSQEKSGRVIDRDDVQLLLPFPSAK